MGKLLIPYRNLTFLPLQQRCLHQRSQEPFDSAGRQWGGRSECLVSNEGKVVTVLVIGVNFF